MADIGYYTLPVILSFDGVDAKVNKALGSKLGLAGKKAGKDFGTNMADGLKSSEAAMKAAADNHKRLADKQADAVGKVRAAEAALNQLRESGANNSRIVAAEERLSKARRDQTRATSDAHNALKEMEAAQKNLGGLGSGVGDLSSKFSGLSSMADSAGEALSVAASVAAGAALAGVVALGTGAVVAGRQLYDLGAEFDDTFDNIRLKTGATGPALQELENATKRLATNVPVSIGEIGNVVAETTRALHLTGPELDEVSERLGRLASWDMPVNIRELGKAFRGFGVAAKDQAPALDSLFSASQKTGIGIDELIASVVKGGPALRAFGLDFGESAGLVSVLDEAGLDVNRTLMGLSSGLAKLAKDGQTGREALSDVVGQIKGFIDAGDDAGALNLSSKLFGSRNGAGFFDAIKSGALDLEALSAAMDGTGDTIAAAAADTDDFAERWQTFKNTAEVALEPLATSMFNLTNGALTDLADWVTQHQPEIIGFFTGLAQTAISASQFVLTSLADVAGGMGELIAPIGDVMGAVNKFQAWQADIRGDHETANELRAQAESFFSMGDGLQDFATRAKNFASTEGDKLSARIGQIGKTAQDAARFTLALGDATASIPDGKTIKIADNSPEVAARMKALEIHIEELPDGTVTVVADTEKGQEIIDSWRKSQGKDPLQVPVSADTSQAQEQIAALGNIGAINVPLNVAPNAPAIGTAGGPLIMPPPRAVGGIYDVFDEVASFANGKLPKQAIIQPAVSGAGLVQWAEPSTEGEAFIPLARSNRTRSQAIWAETGRRLGVLSSYEAGGLNPGASYVRQLIMQMYPQITDIGGYRQPDGFNEHSSGNAIDVMIPNWNTPEGKALGDAVASFALRNADALGLSWVLWQQRSFSPGDFTGQPMPDRNNGDPNANHFNHVHLFMNKLGGQLPTAPIVPGAGAVSAGGFTGGMGGSSGSGGYTAPDPKSLREAQERVDDADARVREAELRQKELEGDAKESQKEAAKNAVEKAKREAQDARADLAETAKGKPAKSSGKGGGAGDGSSDPFKELVKIFGGGILETLGLPDLTSLMPVKTASAALKAFMPMMAGGGDQAGGDGGGAGGGGGGGGGLAKALTGMIPDAYIKPPPAPNGGAHLTGPGGMPAAPGPVYNIDQSMQMNGANLGWDPEATFKQYNRNAKTHRLPS